MNKNKFIKVIGLTVVIIFFLALMDTIGAKMWASLGGWAAPSYAIAEPFYMQLFWYMALAIIGFLATTYFIITKDKSETAALLLTPLILLWAGLEDVFYYAIKGLPLLGQELPWLNNNLFIDNVTKALGGTIVTGQTLIVSVLIGIGIVAVVDWYLLRLD